MRLWVFAKSGYKCEACGSGNDLRGHHLRYRDRLEDCDAEDIMALCDPCHTIWHQHHKSSYVTTRAFVVAFLNGEIPQRAPRKQKKPKPPKPPNEKKRSKKPRKLFNRASDAFRRSDWSRESLSAFIADLGLLWQLLPARNGVIPPVVGEPTQAIYVPKKKEPKPPRQEHWFCPVRQPFQAELVEDEEFRLAVMMKNRADFHAFCHSRGYGRNAIHWSNAFAIYDRWGKMNGRSIPDSHSWVPF